MVQAPLRRQGDNTPVRINLYSDTQTLPSAGMREAMMRAPVGDEQLGADPTVNALTERVAALLGKEAAVFLPSGTMCNVIALRVHCRHGDEVLAHETSHIVTSEGGVHAALTGLQIHPLRGAGGMFTPEAVRAAIRPRSRYAFRQSLLEVEQTANIGGGTIWPLEQLTAVAAVAREQGWATHMDGARLMNACVASGIDAATMARDYDSVWIDFTKGLGAPLGAVLTGSRDFIDECWAWKQRLGGALRQAGLSAAGCLYALDHHVERLADDHAHARRLADGLAAIPGMRAETPQTNLVFFDPQGTGIGADRLVDALRERGIQVVFLGGRIRACTHLDVTASMIDETVAAVREIVARG